MQDLRKHPGITLAALCSIAAFAVAGCGSSDDGASTTSTTSPAASSTSGKKVTFIAGDKGDEFYITLNCGAREEAAKNGISVDFQEPEQFAPSSQTPIVNATAAKRPDALLIAPTDAKAMYVPIKQVADGGSKVVMVDTTLANPSMASSQVSTNDEVGGQQAAQALAKLIGGKGKVIVINLNPGVSTTDARAKGFQDEAKRLGLTVLPQQYAGTSPEKAASIVQSTLARDGDLKGIFTTTNFAQEGAVTGLRGQELVGKVKLVGFDSAPLQVKQLRAGQVQALVAQQARKIGQLGIQQAVAAMTGKPNQKQIKVPTITLTKDNLDDPAVAPGLQVEKCA
jgi:ribose transport system substrate-binding protein